MNVFKEAPEGGGDRCDIHETTYTLLWTEGQTSVPLFLREFQKWQMLCSFCPDLHLYVCEVCLMSAAGPLPDFVLWFQKSYLQQISNSCPNF